MLEDYGSRWAKVVDNFRYLDVEHRHKEKEYGVSWRSEFKCELNTEYNLIVEKHVSNPLNDAKHPGHKLREQKFEVLCCIIEKEFADVLRFCGSRQLDMLHMMKD